jgi:hypothetical protein
LDQWLYAEFFGWLIRTLVFCMAGLHHLLKISIARLQSIAAALMTGMKIFEKSARGLVKIRDLRMYG